VCLCEVVIVPDYRYVRLWLSSGWLVFQLVPLSPNFNSDHIGKTIYLDVCMLGSVQKVI